MLNPFRTMSKMPKSLLRLTLLIKKNRKSLSPLPSLETRITLPTSLFARYKAEQPTEGLGVWTPAIKLERGLRVLEVSSVSLSSKVINHSMVIVLKTL